MAIWNNSIVKSVARQIPGVGSVIGAVDDYNLPSKVTNTVSNAASNVADVAGTYARAAGIANPGSITNLSGMTTKGGGSGSNSGSSDGQGVLPASGAYNPGGGGGGQDRDTIYALAQLSDQEGLLRQLLNSLGTKRDQGFSSIDDSYNSGLNKANTQRARALEDFSTKTQQTEMGRENAIGRVNTNARTLADSLRRMIGQASGSGSSAYQITAPDAVNRKASIERGNVLEDYGQNFADLEIGKRRTDEDYGTLLSELQQQRQDARKNFESGLYDQEINTNAELADIARKRAAVQGGGVEAIRAASAPYQSVIADRNAKIDELFNKYRTPVQARDLVVNPVNLRDYTVDRAGIEGGNQQPVSNSPYANPFGLKEEDQNPLY